MVIFSFFFSENYLKLELSTFVVNQMLYREQRGRYQVNFPRENKLKTKF